jgi:hypothetical protein
MNLAAVLQIVGAALVVLAATFVSITLGVLVAGLFAFGFGIWEELT